MNFNFDETNGTVDADFLLVTFTKQAVVFMVILVIFHLDPGIVLFSCKGMTHVKAEAKIPVCDGADYYFPLLQSLILY